MTRTATTTMLLVLALLALLALAPSPAAANTYDVYSCWAGYGTFRNPNASGAAWMLDATYAANRYAVGDDCGRNSTSGSQSIVSITGYAASNGQHGDLVFAAPEGMSLARARLFRRAWTYGSGSGGASQRNYLLTFADGALLVPEADGGNDAAYGSLGTGDPSNHGIVTSNLLDLSLLSRNPGTFSYRVGCGFDAGCPTTDSDGPAPYRFASGIEMFGAIMSVEDPAAPGLAVADSGLFDSGPRAGTQRVLVSSASDQSGIKRLAVYADGGASALGVLDYEQDQNWCQWWKAAPCQDATNVEIPIDTRQLSDGEHSFVVKAYDAAGNERASTTHVVTIANGGGASSSGAAGGVPNGVGAGPGAKLIVVFARNDKPHFKAGYRSSVTIRGELRSSSGGTIGNAQLDYGALAARPGAGWQDLGAVRTDDKGDFTLKVPAKLGSRRLRFSYRPQLGGPVVATSEIRLRVRAPIKLKVSPKHVRNKQSVIFKGRLGAGPIPRKGKLVDLQVVIDGRWHTFATLRSSRRGRYRYRYTFKRTIERVTYRFRALSRYESSYPFAAGHSKTARVRVN